MMRKSEIAVMKAVAICHMQFGGHGDISESLLLTVPLGIQIFKLSAQECIALLTAVIAASI